MSNKILFCTGEGVGNTIQTIPVVRTLKEVLEYDVDYWHAFGSYEIPKIIPYVDKWITGGEIAYINPDSYIGKVSTFWTTNYIDRGPLSQLKLLNKIVPLRMDRSEIDIYMDIARNLGVKEEDIIWYGKCGFKENIEDYEVVIHDGYNLIGSAGWEVKSYPYYAELADLFISAGFKVCSVGSGHEYVDGTFNLTGLDLMTTLGIIKNCKLFIGNDSGLYHCANALGIKNVVIFTATSIKKNYDRRFHKHSKLIFRDDLKCRPCQGNRGWKKCETWECGELDYNNVFIESIKHMKE